MTEQDTKASAKAAPRDRDTPQRCYVALRRLLIHDQIPPGTRIGEVEWSQRLGAHRPALRQALSLLVHEGLLRRGERGGFFVPAYEQQDIDDILAVRLVIESGAIRMICDAGDVDLSELEAICDMMRRSVEADMEFALVEADHLFHRTLVKLADNPHLTRVYEQAPLPLRPAGEIDPDRRHANYLQTIREHRELLAMLRRQDAANAQLLLQRHLHNSRNRTTHAPPTT